MTSTASPRSGSVQFAALFNPCSRRPEDACKYALDALATKFGVTPRLIRHYAEKGLLAPIRKAKKLLFSDRDVVALDFALFAGRVGFTLAQARELMGLSTLAKGKPNVRPDIARAQLSIRLQALEDEQRAIESAIREARWTIEALDALLDGTAIAEKAA